MNEQIEKLHREMLYCVARVSTAKAGGSGTVLYSEEDPESHGEYINLVLTNEHVVDAAIKTKKEWDPLLKRQVEKEILEPVKVELFDYVYVSRMDSAQAFRGQVLAYDKLEDMAIVRVASPKRIEFVAQLIPRDDIQAVKLFQEIYACGCTYLHDPFASKGMITYFPEIIENREYWQGSANTSFGNSGGAVFTADTLRLIGIPSRITVSWFEVANWMGYFIPPQRIYEFLERQELHFIYDPEDDYYSAMRRREQKQRQALAELAAELQRDDK